MAYNVPEPAGEMIVYHPVHPALADLATERTRAAKSGDIPGYLLAAHAQQLLFVLTQTPESPLGRVMTQELHQLLAEVPEVPGESAALERLATRTRVLSILERSGVLAHETLAPRLHDGVLKPVPEFDWRVDRSLAEVQRRLVVNPLAAVEHLADPNAEAQYTLDLGAGNGATVAELGQQARRKGLQQYVHLGLSDAWYYPMSTLIERMIDFEQLEAAIGEHLNRHERQAFGYFLYAYIVLEQPETISQTGHVAMNRDAQAALAREPELIVDLIAMAAPKLEQITRVPSDICVCSHGDNVHRDFLSQPASPAFAAARRAFMADPRQFLEQRSDVLRHLPFNQQGMMIGDFTRVRDFPDRQFTYMQSARGTVFVSGQAYEDLQVAIASKLHPRGLGVFDCVRRLNGSEYALDALVRIRQRIRLDRPELEIYVFLGPGIAGQDFREHFPVPLSFAVTSPDRFEFLRAQAASGPNEEGVTSVCVPLGQLVSDAAYLEQLDPSGKLMTKIEQSLRQVEVPAAGAGITDDVTTPISLVL